jgi:hypothetical protein
MGLLLAGLRIVGAAMVALMVPLVAAGWCLALFGSLH